MDNRLKVELLQFLMQGKAGHYAPVFERYQQKAEYFMCSCLGKGSRNVQKTPGGLLFRQRWNNMQFVTSASFLATVYSDYLASAGRSIKCASGVVAPSELLSRFCNRFFSLFRLNRSLKLRHLQQRPHGYKQTRDFFQQVKIQAMMEKHKNLQTL